MDIKFITTNKDDVQAAIDGLNHFTKNWCMNVKESEEKNDLVFRCKTDCPFFAVNKRCLIKGFAFDKDEEYTRKIGFGSMGCL